MSYWETLLVIMRRWRISIPAAILAVGVGFATFTLLPPTYEDTYQILFIGSPNQPGEKTLVNPYLGLGSSLISTAAVIQAIVSTPQVAESLEAKGASALYVVGADLSTPAPVLLLTTTGSDPKVVRKTSEAVIGAMDEELRKAQQQAGAPTLQFVSTQVISQLPEPKRKLMASLRPAIAGSVAFLALAMFLLFLREGRKQRKQFNENPGQEVEQAPRQPRPAQPVRPAYQPQPQRQGNYPVQAQPEPVLRERRPAGRRPEPVRQSDVSQFGSLLDAPWPDASVSPRAPVPTAGATRAAGPGQHPAVANGYPAERGSGGFPLPATQPTPPRGLRLNPPQSPVNRRPQGAGPNGNGAAPRSERPGAGRRAPLQAPAHGRREEWPADRPTTGARRPEREERDRTEEDRGQWPR